MTRSFAVEHKAGRVMSSRMLEAVDQALAAAKDTDKLPIVTIDQAAGRGYPRREFVLLPLSVFLRLCLLSLPEAADSTTAPMQLCTSAVMHQ